MKLPQADLQGFASVCWRTRTPASQEEGGEIISPCVAKGE